MAAPQNFLAPLALIPVVYIPALAALPPLGRFGISYDFFFHATEDEPPEGWGAPRSEFPASNLARVLFNA